MNDEYDALRRDFESGYSAGGPTPSVVKSYATGALKIAITLAYGVLMFMIGAAWGLWSVTRGLPCP